MDMEGGGLIDVASIDVTVIEHLQHPVQVLEKEYDQLQEICDALIRGMTRKHTVYRIQCTNGPIYRSFDLERNEAGIPGEPKNPEFITEFLKPHSNHEFINPDNEATIFILLHESIFPQGIPLSTVKDMLKKWQEKVNKGLRDLATYLTSKPPTIRLETYKDLQDIRSNPLEYYNRTHPSYSKYAKPYMPSILLACSPLSHHSELNFLFEGHGLPDFSLYYTVIDNDVNEVKITRISEGFGSGYVIFQREGQQANVLSNILKLSSVLSARFLIGEKIKDKEVNLLDSLSKKSFVESRRFSNAKSGGVTFNLGEAYNDKSVIDESGIIKFSEEWSQYESDTMHEAIERYDYHLNNCTYRDGDGLRIVIENKIASWQKLFHIIAEKRGILEELHRYDTFETKPSSEWQKMNIHQKNIDLVLDECRSISLSDFNAIRDDYLRLHQKRIQVPKSRFHTFLEQTSTLILHLKKVYKVANKLHHSNAKEPFLATINDWGVKFYLTARLKMYKPLREFLDHLKTVLREQASQEPAVADAIMSYFNLQIATNQLGDLQ